MHISIIVPVLTVVAFTFFVAGYIIGYFTSKANWYRKGETEGFKLAIKGDAFAFGSGYLEMRRIDPTKVRLHVDGSNVALKGD